MSGQWWESNLIVGPFSNITEANAWAAANPSSLFLGLLATINGVPYSWGGAGWAAAGNVLPTYETWGEAITAAGTTKGWVGLVRRLCGNGYFHAMHNGSRLGVQCGESIIRDAGPASAGYDLTATGTAYVALASYTIPAGLIGDGEEWEVSHTSKNNGVFSGGGDFPSVRIGLQTLRGSLSSMSGANQVCRGRASIVRLGSIFACGTGNATSDLYNQAANMDRSVDLASSQIIDAGFTPGTIGNTMRLRQWVFRRIG